MPASALIASSPIHPWMATALIFTSIAAAPTSPSVVATSPATLYHHRATVAVVTVGWCVAIAPIGWIRPVRLWVWGIHAALKDRRSENQQERRQRASITPSDHCRSPPFADRQPTMKHDRSSLLLPQNYARTARQSWLDSDQAVHGPSDDGAEGQGSAARRGRPAARNP